MGASVVTRVDATPVFEPAEHILDFVALAIERAVMFDRYFSIGFRRNARRDAALGESPAEPVGVIPLSARSSLARGNAASIEAAPLKSLVWPSLSSMISGRPRPSHTACSFEFKPPLVRPIRLGTGPFLKGWQRCDALSGGSRRSSAGAACRPCAPARRKSY